MIKNNTIKVTQIKLVSPIF